MRRLGKEFRAPRVREISAFLGASMRDVFAIAAYFVGVLCLGALLAPALWHGGHWLGDHFTAMQGLRSVTFQRYFNRAMLVAAVALLWPLAKGLRVRGWREFGLVPNRHWVSDWITGTILAAGLLWLLGAGLLAAGWHEWTGRLTGKASRDALGAALVVPLLEEALFRGALLGLVRRTAGTWTAQVFIAAFFSIVHFLKPPENAAEVAAALGPIDATAGFRLLPHVFWQFREPGLLLGGFLTLFAVGLALGWLTVRTRSLWPAIGLHAGWVLGLKLFSALTLPTAANRLPWLGPNLLIGLLPLGMVLVTWAVAARLFPSRPVESA